MRTTNRGRYLSLATSDVAHMARRPASLAISATLALCGHCGQCRDLGKLGHAPFVLRRVSTTIIEHAPVFGLAFAHRSLLASRLALLRWVGTSLAPNRVPGACVGRWSCDELKSLASVGDHSLGLVSFRCLLVVVAVGLGVQSMWCRAGRFAWRLLGEVRLALVAAPSPKRSAQADDDMQRKTLEIDGDSLDHLRSYLRLVNYMASCRS